MLHIDYDKILYYIISVHLVEDLSLCFYHDHMYSRGNCVISNLLLSYSCYFSLLYQKNKSI